MKETKKLKSIPESRFSRQWTLAKLSLKAGGSYFGKRIAENLSAKASSTRDTALDVIASQVGDWVYELGRMKGSVQKAGQMFSVYGEYFLSPEVNAVLKNLQSDSPSVEWKQIEQQLRKGLGKDRLELLDIDQEPAGAASIGQVHKARNIETSEILALKVQYPGVSNATDSDLASLRRILGFANLGIREGDMDAIFDEVRKMLHQEMDYTKELRFTERFYERLKNSPGYIVPKPHPEFSSKRVFATTWIEAHSLDSEDFLSLPIERRNRIGQLYLDLYFKELFVWGEMQTDPHQGNYKVVIGETSDEDAIVCFDYGATRKIEKSFLIPYRALLRAALRNDSKEFLFRAEELDFLHESDPDDLYILFWQTCRMIIEPFLPASERTDEAAKFFDEDGRYDFGRSDLPDRLLSQIQKMIKKFRHRLPPHQILFLDRKLGGTYIFLKLIGAKLDGRKAIEPYLLDD